MNTDKLDIKNMNELKEHCIPKFTAFETSNFERLCAVGLVFMRMWLEKEILDKDRAKARVY